MNDAAGLDDDNSLGRRMREFRKSHGWSLRSMADRAGLSIGLISLIERGRSSPSIRSLRLLAGALEVPMEWFFQDRRATMKTTHSQVLRSGQRRSLRLAGQGISIQIASPPKTEKLQMFVVELEPGGGSGGEMDQHQGEEAGLVISGEIEFWLGHDHLLLSEGDSFQFSARTPHRYHNHGVVPARVLWVITPPFYSYLLGKNDRQRESRRKAGA